MRLPQRLLGTTQDAQLGISHPAVGVVDGLELNGLRLDLSELSQADLSNPPC